MTPTSVFDTYWKFAAERHAMFFRRLADPMGPWTDDPILLRYRFTNAYRVNDRVTQFLIREVQYNPDRSDDPAELFFRTLLFKFFNRISTWEHLEEKLGPIAWSTTDLNRLNQVLNEYLSRGCRLYSAAYIVPAPPLGHKRKHSNHLALISSMMEDDLPNRILKEQNLSGVYDLLLDYPGIGPFLAYQYTIDLNYSELLSHDETEFVVAGPGALDGIAKCFSDLGRYSPEEVILHVCESQESSFMTRDPTFPTLFGRHLQPIDCQNLFCEVSKYARSVHPEFSGLSGRKKIKQIYRKDVRPLPEPMYPPRWKIEIGRRLEPSRPIQGIESRTYG